MVLVVMNQLLHLINEFLEFDTSLRRLRESRAQIGAIVRSNGRLSGLLVEVIIIRSIILYLAMKHAHQLLLVSLEIVDELAIPGLLLFTVVEQHLILLLVIRIVFVEMFYTDE